MKPGHKSTEFYVIIAVIAVWGAKYLGIDLPADQTAQTVTDIAQQLRGLDNADTGFWLAAIYTISRTFVKVKG